MEQNPFHSRVVLRPIDPSVINLQILRVLFDYLCGKPLVENAKTMILLRTHAAFFVALCLGFANANGQDMGTLKNSRRPNIVIIMADDLGYRDVGCYGCIDFQTPNIDALAKSGIRCTSGYVSHPYCSPSRAGLLSGQYQQTFGHEHNPAYDEQNNKVGIDTGTRLLPAIMSDSGYKTGLIGKWHLGAGKPFRPSVRGLTEFYGFLGGGHDYFKTVPNGTNYNSPMWRDHKPTDDRLTYLTDDLTSEAEKFIERNREDPFCLLLMYNAPHAPDHVTDDYLQRVATIKHAGRRRYAALVQGVDEGVKRIVLKLKSLQLTERTLVVFLSDNGGRRGVSDNRALRGNKGWLHEGGVRVPFILSMPGRLPQDRVYNPPVLALDLLPTALRLGNIAVPKNCNGVNLVPFLTGSKNGSPHESIFWRVSGGEGYAVRHGKWKLVHDVGMSLPELYDLTTDIGEDHDQSKNEPQVVALLQRQFRVWNATLEAPRWTEGHSQNTIRERTKAKEAKTRQWPMPWINPTAAKASPLDMQPTGCIYCP